MIQKDMTIKDVHDLIYGDEGRVLELKKTTGELKDGMKSACAFLPDFIIASPILKFKPIVRINQIRNFFFLLG